MKTPELVRLQERYEHLKLLRAGHEEMLSDAQKYVAPNKARFTGSMGLTSNREDDQSKPIYDSTPVWANQMFANGLSSYLIPKADRWAYLKPEGTPSAELKDDELIFLERLSDTISHIYATPASQFYAASHEAFHDIGSFGNAVVYVNRDKAVPNFKSCALADSFFDVNDEGTVDTMFYRKLIQQPVKGDVSATSVRTRYLIGYLSWMPFFCKLGRVTFRLSSLVGWLLQVKSLVVDQRLLA